MVNKTLTSSRPAVGRHVTVAPSSLARLVQLLSIRFLSTDLPLLPSRRQLLVSFDVNLLLTTGQHILRRDVADGTVQSDLVVMLDVASHQAPRIVQ